MLPGGMTPIVQLVAMIRGAAPPAAAALLMSVPPHRLPELIAALPSADLAKAVQAARPELEQRLVGALPADKLIEVVSVVSAERAVALLSLLPTDHLAQLFSAVPEQVRSELMAALPDRQRDDLVLVVDPRQAHDELARLYLRDVAAALGRVNLSVAVPEGGGDVLLVQVLDWRILVAPRHADDGTTAVREAENAAYHLRANGALSVTGQEPGEAVVRYCRADRRADWPVINAVLWVDRRHDGMLARALVGMVA